MLSGTIVLYGIIIFPGTKISSGTIVLPGTIMLHLAQRNWTLAGNKHTCCCATEQQAEALGFSSHRNPFFSHIYETHIAVVVLVKEGEDFKEEL